MTRIHPFDIFLIAACCCCMIQCSSQKDNQTSDDNAATITAQTQKLSIAQTLRDNNHLPFEERAELYRKLKKEDPNGYNFENEDEMTMYGYSFLWSDNIPEAIAIFKLIVEHFPNSSNPYDSLGEAYLANGDNELSLINYERSLELNPDNFHAEDQIERIKSPNKVAPTLAEQFAMTFSAQEYREDLDRLGKKLTEVHPNVLKFISEEAFWQTIEEKKELITDQTTYSEFRWHCQEIVANVNCSHTGMGNFYLEAEMLPYVLSLPLLPRWTGEQLVVVDALNNADRVNLGDEILTINGISVDQLLEDIFRHIPSQGHIQSAKNHAFNSWACAMIPYALGIPEHYEITLKREGKPIALSPAICSMPVPDADFPNCDENLCLEFLEDEKTAILTISSFNYYPWNNLSVFKDFADDSFQELEKKGIENLIIDVRKNGGGSPESSAHLLRHLVDRPFAYFPNSDYSPETGHLTPFESTFRGKLYFIIDGLGNSTTGHFMALAKDLKLGTIVGEELGSNHFCTGGQSNFRLSNTKTELYIANGTSFVNVTSVPDETGVLPDHYVSQTIDEYLNKVDAVKAYTLNLIEE